MLQLFEKIPLFVWPLFIVLLLGGLKAKKPSSMPIAGFLLIPLLFFCGSIFSFLGKHGLNPLTISLWCICFSLGFFIGYKHMQKLDLKFDKTTKKVEIPGSWIPLTLSMSIFMTKFLIGMITSINPYLQQSSLIYRLELVSTIILGIFLGRGINCLIRYLSFSSKHDSAFGNQ